MERDKKAGDEDEGIHLVFRIISSTLHFPKFPNQGGSALVKKYSLDLKLKKNKIPNNSEKI